MIPMASKFMTEVVLELVRDDCLVVNALPGIECTIDRLSVRPDRTLHSIKAANVCDIVSVLSSQYIKTRSTKKGEVWAESCSCKACALFSRLPFVEIVGSATIGTKMLQIRIVVPTKADLRLLKSHLKDSEIEYRIVSENPLLHKQMTEKEKKFIEVALEKNYFECDDRMSLTELAKIVGVSPSSLSESIRRGTKKAILFYLERNGEEVLQ